MGSTAARATEEGKAGGNALTHSQKKDIPTF